MIQTCWPGHAEDENDISDEENVVAEKEDLIETFYTNGNKEMVKLFSQKCICLERDSD